MDFRRGTMVRSKQTAEKLLPDLLKIRAVTACAGQPMTATAPVSVSDADEGSPTFAADRAAAHAPAPNDPIARCTANRPQITAAARAVHGDSRRTRSG